MSQSSSPSQPGPSPARLECCECAVPVGADGPQRAALLLPCQHVLHMSCVEFLKRRAKVLRLLSSELEGWLDSLPGGGGDAQGHGLSDILFPPSSAFRCPGCQQPVTRIIPLFTAGDVPAPSAAATEANKEFEATLRSQRRLLHRLRRLLEQRDAVNTLGHRCAALHEQRASGLREMDRYNRIFPSLTSSAGSSGAASEEQRRLGVAPLSSLELMTATELELYLAQVAPLAASTQEALRKERRAVERRRARLVAVKTRYHTMKEIAMLDREIEEARRGRQHQRSASDVHLADEVPVAGKATSKESLAAIHGAGDTAEPEDLARLAHYGASAAQNPGYLKRRREPPVIDVDQPLTRRVRLPAPSVASAAGRRDPVDVDGDTEPTEGYDVDEVLHEAPTTAVSSTSRRVELVIDSDGEDDVVAGEHESTAPSSEELSSDEAVVAFQDDEGGDTADDTLASMGLLPPSLVRRTRGVTAPSTKIHANHLRMLPRMQDRLWQPSLEF